MEWLLAIMGISAIVGYDASLITELFNGAEKRQEYENNKKYLEKQLTDELNGIEDAFALEKEEANKKADKQDLTTDVEERLSSIDFNQGMDQIIAEQQQEGFAYNIEAMQAGQQEGNELAQAANSGIRAGSSLAQAVELEAGVNAAQLQLQEDTRRKATDNQLAGLLNNLAKNEYGIWNNRDEADNLRASYEEGGYSYNQKELQKQNWRNKYDLQMMKLNDDFNEYNSNRSYWKRILSGTFTFGTSAMNTANSLYSLYQ